MNLWLRLIAVLIRALRAPPMASDGVSRLPFRVMPGDLDTNGHVNNGRYLTIMDLGRLDLTVRTGLHRAILRHRWRPVVASLVVRFRRELKLGQAFQLETRVLAWDERHFFLEHRMTRGGDVAAVAVIKAVFRGPGGLVSPADVAGAMGMDGPTPPLPEGIARWMEAERALLGAKPRDEAASA